MKLNAFDGIAYALVVVGGINWGLIGFFNYNLVDAIFGEGSALSRIVYAIVGLSAGYLVYTASKLTSHNNAHHHTV